MPARARTLFFLIMSVPALLALSGPLSAQQVQWHFEPRPVSPLNPHLSFGCTATRRCLPRYNYGHDLERFRDSAFAVADPVADATWYAPHLITESYGCDPAQRATYVVPEPLVPENKKDELKRVVRRKPFHFPAASLTANNVTLDQVGLSVYDTGTVRASGRLTHNGGPDGSLNGANATVYLRAYAAPIAQPETRQLPLNSPLVWQSECCLWVGRNQPQVVALTPSGQDYSPELRQYFDEITHLEVELVVQRDR